MPRLSTNTHHADGSRRLIRRMAQPHGNYPATAAEVLDPPVQFKSITIEILERFKASNPWRGHYGPTRWGQAKFSLLHRDLCAAYGLSTELVFGYDFARRGVPSGTSNFRPGSDLITLHGRVSVVTYLHEFSHALHGPCGRRAVRWSLNLFRKVFPEQFARLDFTGHVAQR